MAGHHPGCLELDPPSLCGFDRPSSIDRFSQGIHDPPDQCLSDWHLGDPAGALYRIPLFDEVALPKDRSAYVVLLQIKHHTMDSVWKLQEFSRGGPIEPVDAGNAITGRKDCTNFLYFNTFIVVLDLLFDNSAYFCRSYIHYDPPAFFSVLAR